jgi:hypothetical protein
MDYGYRSDWWYMSDSLSAAALRQQSSAVPAESR